MKTVLSGARKSAGGKNRRRITILGSTGSVGQQTVDLIERDMDKYEIVALTAKGNVSKLVEQARKLKPRLVVIADEMKYHELKDALADTKIEVAAGAQAIEDSAKIESDWIMSAIVGAAGLPATLAAARRGATIAFANKETLVCAGPLMMKLVAEAGATLLPVDSEHNAIWQVLNPAMRDAVSRIIITASGGPFRTFSREQMVKVTPEQAVLHPVWSMGAKISIDSATFMNKALEIIEAYYLFQMPSEKIDVIVHPQSVVHSMVEYTDGSVLAQLGTPDMRIPIGSTLAWPKRMATPAAKLDLAKLAQLTFEEPDAIKFPALRLAREAMAKGGTAPAILSAANEVAVQAFLDKRIGFLDIVHVNEAALNNIPHAVMNDLEVMMDADQTARRYAATQIELIEDER
ncbi:MAG: 1-deoxy-D-xylulose-5-phosphate reductoisomerase [Alphaproteobacteria bacterium]|nr:1-deoxy-D-xylulose-5-phosphate reductoisomerase [Alphaproteobacteria bacterium]